MTALTGAERRARYKARKQADGFVGLKHGTDRVYSLGCRCTPCTSAHSAAMDEWRSRRLAAQHGEPEPVMDRAAPLPQELQHEPLTYRQFDHWIRRGYLKPIEPTPGSGNGRWWPPGELAIAARMARLVHAGFRTDAAANLARADGTYIAASEHVSVWLAS